MQVTNTIEKTRELVNNWKKKVRPSVLSLLWDISMRGMPV